MVRLRKAGDLLLERLLARQEFVFLDQIGFPVNILVKIGIQKTLEFRIDFPDFLPLALSKRTTGLGKIGFFTFQFLYHLVCPVLAQRNCLDHDRELPVEFFLADKALMAERGCRLFRTAVVDIGGVAVSAAIVLDVEFSRHHHAALPATNKSQEGFGYPRQRDRLTSALDDLLYRIKQFLCDEWRMNPFVDLARVAEMAVIERVSKEASGDVINGPLFPTTRDNAMFRQKVRNVHNPVGAGGKQFERLPDDGSLLAINDDGFAPGIVEIPHRRQTRVLTLPDFLAKTSFGIF